MTTHSKGLKSTHNILFCEVLLMSSNNMLSWRIKKTIFLVEKKNKNSLPRYLELGVMNLVAWAQLFKANDVVSQRFVKIYIERYANMLKFVAEKM